MNHEIKTENFKHIRHGEEFLALQRTRKKYRQNCFLHRAPQGLAPFCVTSSESFVLWLHCVKKLFSTKSLREKVMKSAMVCWFSLNVLTATYLLLRIKIWMLTLDSMIRNMDPRVLKIFTFVFLRGKRKKGYYVSNCRQVLLDQQHSLTSVAAWQIKFR